MQWEEDMNWSGIMAFSPDKKPFINEVEPGIFAAIRMNGMGVALASGAAEKLANQSGLIYFWFIGRGPLSSSHGTETQHSSGHPRFWS